mmetsp:Transcript_2180/g.14435  ORF Transcript_2180/g.14435 Transcript_2180/m.14435 type:complete len:212 (-) Transcript_2180:879-1514(-)
MRFFQDLCCQGIAPRQSTVLPFQQSFGHLPRRSRVVWVYGQRSSSQPGGFLVVSSGCCNGCLRTQRACEVFLPRTVRTPLGGFPRTLCVSHPFHGVCQVFEQFCRFSLRHGLFGDALVGGYVGFPLQRIVVFDGIFQRQSELGQLDRPTRPWWILPLLPFPLRREAHGSGRVSQHRRCCIQHFTCTFGLSQGVGHGRTQHPSRFAGATAGA